MQCLACCKSYVNVSCIDKWRPLTSFQKEFLNTFKGFREGWPKLCILPDFTLKQFSCTLRLAVCAHGKCLNQPFINLRIPTSAKITE